MGLGICTTGLLMCPFGAAPAPFVALPRTVIGTAGPMGMGTDSLPFLNIPPFGVCMSILNPATAALTAAAFGVLTPGPCIPTPAGVWLPMKPNVIGPGGPMMNSDTMLICAYGGVIRLTMPAQFTVLI